MSDSGKGSLKESCQVRSEEMNESEPSMECRKSIYVVKTEDCAYFRDKLWHHLSLDKAATGIEVA